VAQRQPLFRSHAGEELTQRNHILLHAVFGFRDSECGRRMVRHQAEAAVALDALPVGLSQASLLVQEPGDRPFAEKDDDLRIHQADLPIQPVFPAGFQFARMRRAILRRSAFDT